MKDLTPQMIVAELDKFIIGQDQAKRSVAIALRNRWRRQQVDENLRQEITPKNILMIGPTGVGKTEISRRLSKLVDAPFIKVEATKFTEVGYVGRDVESIIRDLMETSMKMVRERALQQVRDAAELIAEDRVLDAMLPGSEAGQDRETGKTTREKFRRMLRAGNLDHRDIEVELDVPSVSMEIMTPPGMEGMVGKLQSMFDRIANTRPKKMKIKVAEALQRITEEESNKLVNDGKIKDEAVENVEQNGLVFIDEFDKIASRGDARHGPDVSQEGVQRDLLPLVEGCTVSTRYGMVNTDHILFIGSGAFHFVKPSDLIPEMQGRFPIRVELKPLSAADFERILTEPNASLTRQYRALLDTERIDLVFADNGIRRLAELSWQVNERTENIGARRLHTVMERLLEELSFSAGNCKKKKTVRIDESYVNKHLGDLVDDVDLSRYIL